MQRSTAQGPIIVDQVYGDDSPVKYDEDIVMMLGDYYHVSLPYTFRLSHPPGPFIPHILSEFDAPYLQILFFYFPSERQ